MEFERVLTDAEDIRALTTQHASDQTATVPGLANDLLDCCSGLGQIENGGVGVFAAKISLVLDPLGGRQQLGVDRGGSDRGSDLAHGFAHRIEECPAGVLHQVPAVSDLGRLWQRPDCSRRVTTAAVASDNADLGLVREPSLGRRRLPIWQESNGLHRSGSQMMVP